jgi:hypothetical protein
VLYSGFDSGKFGVSNADTVWNFRDSTLKFIL